ncbi:CheR family methyltransferase [Teichococcus aestuarii]|uniref:CheR family methyltransferase n=1 Tax=Teichococcus aestuarii TaxID=568898 RepID=UPI003615D0AD
MMPPLPAEALASQGLERLVGLSDGMVLQGRLRRAAPLIAEAGPGRLPSPEMDDPFWARLIDAVTVQETRLFRTPKQWLGLAARVLPGLAGLGRPAQLLSAGCATGEEAWTLAVLAAGAGLPARVLGLDLCRPALERAASGLFPPGPPDPLRDVPPPYRRFFTVSAEGVQARPGPYVSVRVARANLLDLPGAGPSFDVILCRNVLIYLTSEARERVLRRLLARLAPGGALLLGATDLPPPELGLRPWAEDQPCLWCR